MIQELIYSRTLADPDLALLIADRMYFEQFPINVVVPFVVYSTSVDQRVSSYAGSSHLTFTPIVFSIYAPKLQALTISEHLRRLWRDYRAGFIQRIEFLTELTQPDPALNLVIRRVITRAYHTEDF